MRTYTVHESPIAPVDRLERAESLVFVKDGFSFPAAVAAPFWMIAKRLWLVLLIYLGVVGLIEFLVLLTGAGQQVGGWMLVALHLLVGFESDSLQRWTFRRHGYRFVGAVSGRRYADCERRFFESWLRDQPFIAPRPSIAEQSALRGQGTGGRLSIMALREGRT